MIETASPTPVPTPESARILPGADFDDAYRLIVRDGALDAAVAAERAMARAPKWVWPLMALRNLIMAPFGVRVGFRRTAADEPRLGMFPVVSRAPDRVGDVVDAERGGAAREQIDEQRGRRAVAAAQLGRGGEIVDGGDRDADRAEPIDERAQGPADPRLGHEHGRELHQRNTQRSSPAALIASTPRGTGASAPAR